MWTDLSNNNSNNTYNLSIANNISESSHQRRLSLSPHEPRIMNSFFNNNNDSEYPNRVASPPLLRSITPAISANVPNASTISSTSPRSTLVPLHIPIQPNNSLPAAMPTKSRNASCSSASSNVTRSRNSSFSASNTSLNNPENVLDSMEKEQEGIVLKLMKEIKALKEENSLLKQQLLKFSNSSITNFNSISNSNSTPSPTPLSTPSTTSIRSQRRATFSDASLKRVPTTSSSIIGTGIASPTSGCTETFMDLADPYDFSLKNSRRNSLYSQPSTRKSQQLFGNYTLKVPNSNSLVKNSDNKCTSLESNDHAVNLNVENEGKDTDEGSYDADTETGYNKQAKPIYKDGFSPRSSHHPTFG